jgi:hypothetical protein
MMMNRRTFSTALLTGAAASLIATRGMAANAAPRKARNVVLVHGLFAAPYIHHRRPEGAVRSC